MYHKIQAILACIVFGFPGRRLGIIAVTGTSGKSTTVNLIHALIQSSGINCGAISTINFHIGEKEISNKSLRTTLRPWHTQKLLRKMIQAGCQYCVVEASSHAIDQHRLWGVPFDTVVLTNISGNEHLDYHGTFTDYLETKMKIFKNLNFSVRKPNIPKVMVLNRDDENFELFEEFPADLKRHFSQKKPSDVMAKNLELHNDHSSFHLDLPNANLDIETPIVGVYNIENLLAAIAVVSANGILLDQVEESLRNFSGIPGRLEPIREGQDFSVIVDFAYKPSALEAVLDTLKPMTDGKIITVFGGCYGRTDDNYQVCGKLLNEKSDIVILTTDDPEDTDPKYIARQVKTGLDRAEGDQFFEIEDRYEAIRYAIFTANPGDCVLIAGRGHEGIQTIGDQQIEFDDRVVARAILDQLK
jgi:UDP-N-acetylmuramoyl-L-alanyl-D-glutamate--2,6-diaminopimelate ligase